MTKFYYKVLGLSESASREEIKQRYKKLALQWHPDKNPDNPKRASEMFNIISEAYQILGNESRKTAYDKNSSYKPSKLYSPTDLFNHIFKNRRNQYNQDGSGNSVNSLIPYFNNSILGDLFTHANIGSFKIPDTHFSTQSLHQSSTIFRNGIGESVSTREYTRNGKTYIEKKHTTIDKAGKKHTKVKRYIKSNNNLKSALPKNNLKYRLK